MNCLIAMFGMFGGAGTISIESQGCTVEQLVNELGRHSGLGLSCSSKLAKDRVIVRMDRVPFGTAMKMVAAQQNSKWEMFGEQARLVRDPSLEAKQSRAEQDRSRVNWQGKLDWMAQKMGGPRFNLADASDVVSHFEDLSGKRNRGGLQEFVRLEEASYELPSGRALVRLLASLGSERLSEFVVGTYEFCTSPNSLQLPFGDEAKSILEQYKAEKSTYDQASVGRKGGGLSMDGSTPANISTATGIILKLSFHRTRALATLFVYDSSRKILEQTLNTLSVDGEKELQNESAQDLKDRLAAAWEQIPEVSKDLYLLRDERLSDENIRDIWSKDSAVKDALMHPESQDIDGLIFGRQVLAMGRSRKVNIVAPELAELGRFLPVSAFQKDNFNTTVIKTRLDPYRSSGTPEDWYLVKESAEMVSNHTLQLSPEPIRLGAFFAESLKLGKVSLDSLAPLYAPNQGSYSACGVFDIERKVLQSVHPDMQGWGWFENEPSSLGFYGSLSLDQHQAATESGLSLAALTADNWQPLLSEPWRLEGTLSAPGIAAQIDTIYTDPFVFFGLTDSKIGFLRFEVMDKRVLGLNTDGRYFYLEVSDWSARQKGNQEKGNNEPKFRLGAQKSVRIIFTFANNATMQLELSCNDPIGPEFDRYSDLPPGIRDEFPLGTVKVHGHLPGHTAIPDR